MFVLLLLLLYHLPRSALRRVFWRCFCHFCSDLRNNFMSNLAIFPSWIEWMKWICGTYFFGFGVPVFAVVDIWLDKTTKRHPLRIYTFCQYIVCRKLCPAGCEEDTGNSTVFCSGSAHVWKFRYYVTPAESATQTLVGFLPRSRRSVIYN